MDIAWRLEGELLPAVSMPSTAGGEVALDRLRGHWTALFTYVKNMAEMPGVIPPVNWSELPGCSG